MDWNPLKINGLATYYKPGTSTDDPVVVFHHGAGSTARTFTLLIDALLNSKKEILCIPKVNLVKEDTVVNGSDLGILAFDMRGHGLSATENPTNSENNNLDNNDGKQNQIDLSLDTLVQDFISLLSTFNFYENSNTVPKNLFLVGHSLGGAVVISAANLLPNIKGVIDIDALQIPQALASFSMRSWLWTRPNNFDSLESAINWHIKSRLIHNKDSAKLSVPSTLKKIVANDCYTYTWITDLKKTEPYWTEWFKDLSEKFLNVKAAKMLFLNGTEKLDKNLIIGQMQGKFQMCIVNGAGHFIQEDNPEKVSELLFEFIARNSRTI